MSQGVEVPEEIEHLDFEPEREEGKTHWGDPIRRDLFWCGQKIPSSEARYKYSECTIRGVREVTCVKCLQLALSLGTIWWWETHRKFFNSSCNPNSHNCGA